MTKSIGPNDIVPPKYYSGWGHGEHNKHEKSYIVDSSDDMVDYTFEISDEMDISGPFKSAFEASTEGVIRQEFITYKMRDDGIMIKEVSVRKYTLNDYIDSKDVIPLGEIGK
tara:strand:+ start:283 stop:618 length:336 start_codon:yes stop_codon:yes gene_type:complete